MVILVVGDDIAKSMWVGMRSERLLFGCETHLGPEILRSCLLWVMESVFRSFHKSS